jgi:hypothetical protein
VIDHPAFRTGIAPVRGAAHLLFSSQHLDVSGAGLPGMSDSIALSRLGSPGSIPSLLARSGHSVEAIIGPDWQAGLSKKGQTRTRTVWDTSLLAPRRKQMAQTTCSECKAQYKSERELRDHLATAHRKFGSAQNSFTPRNKRAGASAVLASRPPN